MSKSNKLTKKKIFKLFDLLNAELKKSNIVGELYLVGGAVLCIVHNTRPSTNDIDAYFQPSAKIRKAAENIAIDLEISSDWINDGVKAFMSPHGEYQEYLELSHLKILTAEAEYLLAMKCLSFRIGEEFHDEEDISYLLRYCNVTSFAQAKEIISRYYPIEHFPQKTFYALAEMLSGL